MKLQSFEGSSDEILERFLSEIEEAGIEPYDHQEEAILELFSGRNVILNTPTGSGKSLVALAMQFRTLCLGRVSYYTVPIKALANEKFLSLCQTFGAENVGLITGDATVNPEARIICCTSEILANLALREGAQAKVDDVIIDEFHYYSDRDRGWSWQVPLLTLPQARFLLMSATLGDTERFERRLSNLTSAETTLVKSEQRPVPLEFNYSESALTEKAAELVEQGRAPIYLVHFTQLACAASAQALTSTAVCSKEEKKQIAELLTEGDFRSPYGKDVLKYLRHGIGIHHAGLLPRYRVLVEKLSQKGLLKVICGTDTLGVGVNVPIRTVLFTQLCKYDGKGTGILTVRDFQQICGRAGRRGFDNIGYVVAQAPEHVVENKRLEAKAAGGKKGKIVKKKPPEHGFVNWDEKTFEKLQTSEPEALVSQFRVTHGMILNVLSRAEEDGCAELKVLIEKSDETNNSKKKLRANAWQLFRGLVEGKVLEIVPVEKRTGPQKVRLNVDLQDDFSMNHALGLYLLEAIQVLDREDIAYPLNVLSLIEAIVEDPQVVLRSQVNKAKTELMAQLKEEGIGYDERLERLEEVTWPKPGEEFIYDTYNKFAVENEWVREAGVRPKSVAREIAENYYSFVDYVKLYKLEKSEAVLLRHLSEVYKVLAQGVPPAAKTEDLIEVEEFLEDIVRNVDSSLLDEWELLQNPNRISEDKVTKERAPSPKEVRNHQERKVRSLVWNLLKSLSQDSFEDFHAQIANKGEWSRGQFDQVLDDYYSERRFIRMDPAARSKSLQKLEQNENGWEFEQLVLDDDDEVYWRLNGLVQFEEVLGQGVLTLVSFTPIEPSDIPER